MPSRTLPESFFLQDERTNAEKIAVTRIAAVAIALKEVVLERFMFDPFRVKIILCTEAEPEG